MDRCSICGATDRLIRTPVNGGVDVVCAKCHRQSERLSEAIDASLELREIARLRAELALTTAQRDYARATVDEVLNLVSPENDPAEADLTPEGVVRNVRELIERNRELSAALAAEREACDEYRRRCMGRTGFDDVDQVKLCITPEQMSVAGVDWSELRCSPCRAHDARRAAEAKEST